MKFRGIAFLLCGICIAVFVLQLSIPSLTDWIALDQQSWLQAWRFLTALFAHGSLAHLLYNLLALALFGSVLESVIGARKFCALFLSTGVAANLIAIFMYQSSLGASGAIFGVIGALVVLRPSMAVFVFGLPMPLFIAALIWAAGDIIGLFVPSDVDNAAHLAGLAFGFVAGATLRRQYAPRVPPQRQNITLDEQTMRRWEDRYLS